MKAQSYIYSSKIMTIAAGGSDQDSIQIDGSHRFQIDDIVVHSASDEVLLTIGYNSNLYFCEASYINNVANNSKSGVKKQFDPFTLKSNSAINMELENKDSNPVTLQISFIGKKLFV